MRVEMKNCSLTRAVFLAEAGRLDVEGGYIAEEWLWKETMLLIRDHIGCHTLSTSIPAIPA